MRKMNMETKKDAIKTAVGAVVGVGVCVCTSIAVNVIIDKVCPGLEEGVTGAKKVMLKVGTACITSAAVGAVCNHFTKESDELIDSAFEGIEAGADIQNEMDN